MDQRCGGVVLGYIEKDRLTAIWSIAGLRCKRVIKGPASINRNQNTKFCLYWQEHY